MSMRGPGKLDGEEKAALNALRSHENKLWNAAMTDEQRNERNKYWLAESTLPALKGRHKEQTREWTPKGGGGGGEGGPRKKQVYECLLSRQ